MWVWGWLVRFAGRSCVPESACGWCWLVCMAPHRAFPPVSASSFTHRAFPPVSASSFTRRAFPPVSASSFTHRAFSPVSASSFTHRAFPSVSASSFTHRAFSPVSASTLSLQLFSPLSLSSLAYSAHPRPLHFKVFLPCVRPTLLSLNILPKCPAFRAMQDICLTDCGSGFYVLS